MKYIYLLILSMTLSVGYAQQLKQIERGTSLNQIPVTNRTINGVPYIQVYRDALPYILDTLGVRDTILALSSCCLDSIYIVNDTIFLRDGSGFVPIHKGIDSIYYQFGALYYDKDSTNYVVSLPNFLTGADRDDLNLRLFTSIGYTNIDTSLVPLGGVTGQIIQKKISGYEWVDHIYTDTTLLYPQKYYLDGIGLIDSTNCNTLRFRFINNNIVDNQWRSLCTTLTGGSGSTEYFDPYIIAGDTVGVILQNTQDTVHFIGAIGSVIPESTTVSDSPTINMTLTGFDISSEVIDGSITPAKLDRTYATITSVATTNTFATSSNTLGNWSPSLEYIIPSSGEYKVELIGKFQSSATTTGASIQIFCSACTYHGGEYKVYTTINTGTTTNQNRMVNSSSDSVTSPTVSNINTNHVFYGQIFISANTSDAIVAKFASEINGSTVTFQPDTRLVITKIN